MPFYYLTANKTRDLCHNSGPLASLRLKYTWGGALISVDLLKITLPHNGLVLGLYLGELVFRVTLYTEPLLWYYFDGLIYGEFIFGGAYIRSFTLFLGSPNDMDIFWKTFLTLILTMKGLK